MLEKLRDKSREELADCLRSLGITVELSARGRSEETIRGVWFSFLGVGSKGIIDIQDNGTIKWVNVVKVKNRDRNGPPRYRMVLGIPDQTIPLNHKRLKITTVRKKTFPLFGKVVDVYWRGTSNLQALIKIFSDDTDIANVVSELGDMSVYTHPRKFHGWTLDITSFHSLPMPTKQQWKSLQKIANYLLSSPRN